MSNKKQIYVKPLSEVYRMEMENLLTKFSGSAGTLKPGTGAGDAKKFDFSFEEEEENIEKESLFPWEY